MNNIDKYGEKMKNMFEHLENKERQRQQNEKFSQDKRQQEIEAIKKLKSECKTPLYNAISPVLSKLKYMHEKDSNFADYNKIAYGIIIELVENFFYPEKEAENTPAKIISAFMEKEKQKEKEISDKYKELLAKVKK